MPPWIVVGVGGAASSPASSSRRGAARFRRTATQRPSSCTPGSPARNEAPSARPSRSARAASREPADHRLRRSRSAESRRRRRLALALPRADRAPSRRPARTRRSSLPVIAPGYAGAVARRHLLSDAGEPARWRTRAVLSARSLAGGELLLDLARRRRGDRPSIHDAGPVHRGEDGVGQRLLRARERRRRDALAAAREERRRRCRRARDAAAR